MLDKDAPITREEAEKIIQRIRKLEDYFFAFKVLSTAVVAVSVFLGWLIQHVEEIKTVVTSIIGGK